MKRESCNQNKLLSMIFTDRLSRLDIFITQKTCNDNLNVKMMFVSRVATTISLFTYHSKEVYVKIVVQLELSLDDAVELEREDKVEYCYLNTCYWR